VNINDTACTADLPTENKKHTHLAEEKESYLQGSVFFAGRIFVLLGTMKYQIKSKKPELYRQHFFFFFEQ